MNDQHNNSPEISFFRVNILTDVIFATAMIMLVFGMDLPKDIGMDKPELLDEYIQSQATWFFVFITSFIVVAIYWFKHLEKAKYIHRTDQKYLWLEIFYLAFIMLVPLCNGLMTAFPNVFVAQTVYSLTIFFVGLFSFFSWNHATSKKRLVDEDLDSELIMHIKLDSLSEPIVALLAILVAWVYPVLYDFTFILIPIFFFLRKRYRSRNVKTSQSK